MQWAKDNEPESRTWNLRQTRAVREMPEMNLLLYSNISTQQNKDIRVTTTWLTICTLLYLAFLMDLKKTYQLQSSYNMECYYVIWIEI